MGVQPDSVNRRILLESRPDGLPQARHFIEDAVPRSEPGPGEVLIETLYVSVDPAMRVWMNEDPGYVPPVLPGEVMRASGIGRVIRSDDERFRPGDLVLGRPGWQSHPVLPGSGLSLVDLSLGSVQDWMGPLGTTGLTAYFGLEVGALRGEDRVLVSAASGGVGQMAAQLARLAGARVAGMAGGPEKCVFLKEELGLHEVIDYKTVPDVESALDTALPAGIDLYFDNVGGPLLDAVLKRLRPGGRIVICGRISQTASSQPYGITNLGELIARRARVEGFVVSDFVSRFDEARRWLAERLGDGRLRQRLHILEGLERAPEGLVMLFRGENLGKLLVRVAPE